MDIQKVDELIKLYHQLNTRLEKIYKRIKTQDKNIVEISENLDEIKRKLDMMN